MKAKRFCPECGNEIKGNGKYCTYECSFPAQVEASKQISAKKGPIYEKWRARLKASVARI